MIEEESNVDPKAVAEESDNFGKAMLYDFAKFLTTMSLLVLGGVLTVTQTAHKAVAKPPVVAMVMGFIALAGIFSISAAGKLANVKIGKDHPRFTARDYLVAAVAFLGMGAGGFLTIWWKTL